MSKKVKVLVVDDSYFVTTIVSKRLELDPDIVVVGVAHNGLDAIEKIKELQPTVVTLDVVMPVMSGLDALRRIMRECPTPVVMLSALTGEGAEATIEALELGAVDFFLKPSTIHPTGNDNSSDELIEKVKNAAAITPAALKSKLPPLPDKAAKGKVALKNNDCASQILVIGSSTGGPRALMQVVPLLPRDFPVAVLIVQHMPSGFTRSMAERLNGMSRIEVREAANGDKLRSGQALVAPGDYHMNIDGSGEIYLSQEPPLWGVRPSIDITMESVVPVYGEATTGVILTGMGVDGTHGAYLIKKAGGTVIAQDEATSAVYGMPMSVANKGYVDKIVPIQLMASEITKSCLKKNKKLVREVV